MKILVVEDDRAARMLIRRFLEGIAAESVEIIEAVDGWAAWELLRNGLQPDLAIIDLMMPRMDGLTLLEKIRSVFALKKLKIIICSAVQERMQITQVESLEIDAYLFKPLTARKLLNAVHKVSNIRVTLPAEPLSGTKGNDPGQKDPATSPKENDPAQKEISPAAKAFEDFLRQYHKLTTQVAREMDLMNRSLQIGDRATMMAHVRSMLKQARFLEIPGLTRLLLRVESSLFTDSQANLTLDLQALKQEHHQMEITLGEMLKRHQPAFDPDTPVASN